MASSGDNFDPAYIKYATVLTDEGQEIDITGWELRDLLAGGQHKIIKMSVRCDAEKLREDTNEQVNMLFNNAKQYY